MLVFNVERFDSNDTNVSKFAFTFYKHDDLDEVCVETVLYKYGSYKNRTVICCSVQCGCPVGCTFCGTGKFFVRNLTKDEIVAQIHHVLSLIDCDTKDIDNFQIMFMSMGEPFLNYNNLKESIIELHDNYPNAQLLVSTSAPKILTESGWENFANFMLLSKNIECIGLQFSVHESTDEARSKLIPTSTCTLEQIAHLGEMWHLVTQRKPRFNYCVRVGNNTEKDADNLCALFDNNVWCCTLSVICEKCELGKCTANKQLDVISIFGKMLSERGMVVKTFNPAGQDDIGGGCGQLWYFQRWNKERIENKQP